MFLKNVGAPANVLLAVAGECWSHGTKVRAISGFSMLWVDLLFCFGVGIPWFSFKLHRLLVPWPFLSLLYVRGSRNTSSVMFVGQWYIYLSEGINIKAVWKWEECCADAKTVVRITCLAPSFLTGALPGPLLGVPSPGWKWSVSICRWVALASEQASESSSNHCRSWNPTLAGVLLMWANMGLQDSFKSQRIINTWILVFFTTKTISIPQAGKPTRR